MDDIKDVKPPVNLPVEWAGLIWWMAAIAVLALAAFAVFVYWRRRKARGPKAVIVPSVPPWEVALRQLEELALKQYPQKGMFKVYYTALSDITRRYLENRFNIRAPEMTTEEFLVFANASAALNDAQKSTLAEFLRGCDMVKFARHQPSADDAKMSFDHIMTLIQDTRLERTG